MASSYMLANRVQSYQVTVSQDKRGHKIVERKSFKDYYEAMAFLDAMESKYYKGYRIEFDTKFR